MIVNLGPDLRIKTIPQNWVIESLKTYKTTKAKDGVPIGTEYEEWRIDGYFTTLESAFVHCGRKFLERIDGEFGTDALPALFELTDEFKRLGKEAVERLPGLPA